MDTREGSTRNIVTSGSALSGEEIEGVLGRVTLGRIACADHGRVYIIPISYAYDGEHVYGCSWDGLKLRTMRAQPSVCVEVEEHLKNGDIRSVVAWGKFEEIEGDLALAALDLFALRFGDEIFRRVATQVSEPAKVVVYRVRLTKRTGRTDRPLRRVAAAFRAHGLNGKRREK